MNDIDERCDLYLESLNRAKREKDTFIDQIKKSSILAEAILSFDKIGIGASSIQLVASAFQFVQNSIDAYYSRLILHYDKQTIRSLVRKRQTAYRTALENGSRDSSTPYMSYVTNRPAAYFAVRGYLRLCLPTTIESEIEAAVSGVKYDANGARGISPGDKDPDLERLKTMPRTVN